jgi:hypothetical protein
LQPQVSSTLALLTETETAEDEQRTSCFSG